MALFTFTIVAMQSFMKEKRKKKPWPTQEVMKQIYEMQLWGAGDTAFYSGIGSHHTDMVDPYLKAVNSFLRSFENPIIVCDLGCGDFNVGKELVPYTQKYIGVDIVPDLITHHREKFKVAHLEFHCLDIAKDDLPTGDCAILRQVLQHLSNTEIHGVLEKLYQYRYIILTEHIPEGDFEPNKDIITGQGIRLKKQSGVQLSSPPFNFKVKEEKMLLSTHIDEHPGAVVTTLFTVF